MITDLMPLLPSGAPGSSGYVPTSLSSRAPGAATPTPDRSAPAHLTMPEAPFGSGSPGAVTPGAVTPGAVTPGGGQPALGHTAATRPQPVLGAGASTPSGYSPPPSAPSPSRLRFAFAALAGVAVPACGAAAGLLLLV